MSPATLKGLSLEDLTNLEVTSVSRHPQKLLNTASAIQVITGQEIRRSGATSIPEALRLADNLDVAQINSHDWAITARGFNTSLANKLLVLIDGRTVYTPLFSGVFWDRQNYLLADIERIEVISGPGGTQWGANAVNGVINIITKNAQDTQGGYLELDGGTHLHSDTAMRYGTRLSDGVYARAYGEYVDRGAEAFGNGSSAGDDWHLGQAGFRVDAQPTLHNTLTLQGDFYNGSLDAPGNGGTSRTRGCNLLGRWSYGATDVSGTTLQAYYDRARLSKPVAALTIGTKTVAPASFFSDELETYDVDFQRRFAWGDAQRIDWGLGYRFTHDAVSNAQAIAFLPTPLDQSLYSAFVQDEIRARSDLVVTLGTKLEHNDYTGFEIEPSARAQWAINADQVLWAALSRAVRTPSRVDRDLYEPTPPRTPAILTGSADFISETVLAHEIGYRVRAADRLVASVSAFYNDYNHIRSLTITPTTVVPFYFQNNVEGSTRGIEISVDYQVSDTWRVHAGYSALGEDLRVKPGAIDVNKGHNETADPRQRVSLRTSFDLRDDLEFDALLRWVATRPLNNGPTVRNLGDYAEMDLRIGWHPTSRLELSLVGQNLLHDRHAEYGFPGPAVVNIERGVYGKLVWHF